jgi:hypothetical protein|tara:strand:- start:523 stop:1110 length:588 start_codon:yes stop_codon:yes gene_type:complete
MLQKNKMRFKLLILMGVFLLGINLVIANPFYYKLDLNYEDGEVEIVGIEVEFLDEGEKYDGEYLLQVFEDDKVLEEINFDFPLESLYEEIDEDGRIIDGGLKILNQTKFELFIPYYEKADKIIIYDSDNSELILVSLGSFVKKISGESDSENGIIKEKESKDVKKKSLLLIFIVVLVVFIFLAMVLFKKRRKNVK